MRGFLRVLLFVVVGPYVGLLALALLIGSHTLATTGSMRDFTFGPELLSPGILLVVYTVGGLPALLSGVLTLIVSPRLAGWRYWLAMALIGGLLSFAGTFVLFGGGPEMFGVRDEAPLIFLVAATGAIAAFVCAALFDGLVALFRQQAT